MNPPSCFPFPKHDRTRDDEDKQRHHHATENQKRILVQSKPKSKPKRRRITQTKQNQRKIKPKGHLLYHREGTRPECTVCYFTNNKHHRTYCQHGRTYCQHGIRELPSDYIPVAHFQKTRSSSRRRHPPIYPQYFHVLDDAEASTIFLTHLSRNGIGRPRNREALIKIFKDMRNPHDHPLNSNGTFEQTGRCIHQDEHRGTDCTRDALIKGIPFCYEHMPASIMLKVLPPPELKGTLAEQDLTKFVFWMQSRGGTVKDWSTKTTKEKEKILKGSAQRLKISLQNMSYLTGNTDNFNWLK